MVEMRVEPSSSSEVDSQALFSEQIFLLDEQGEWQQIATSVDNYKGWIKHGALVLRSRPFPENKDFSVKVARCAAHLYSTTDTIYGPIMTLPFESCLEVKEKVDERWLKVVLPDATEAFIQSGDVKYNLKLLTIKELCSLSCQFLGLPYTWGGRSSFGYDCSGFIQMLYRQLDGNIALPRNARQQCDWDKAKTIALSDLKQGDLLFWGHSAEAIKHVGLALDDKRFIHTCAVSENQPYVRISSIADPTWNGNGHYSYVTARRIL